MNKMNLKYYRCPYTNKPLNFRTINEDGLLTNDGVLVNSEGEEFRIIKGIPDLTWPKQLCDLDKKTKEEYDSIASQYDKVADFPFKTFRENEIVVRNKMVDKLKINPGDTVLEVGCGSGRGSEIIIERLKDSGKLFLQDISPNFLNVARQKFKNQSLEIDYSIANGCYLPFANDTFDAAYHFGGLNTFSDIKKCLYELTRVVKPGGKVVVGDEGIAPWLRETEFAKIVINANPMYGCELDLVNIPLLAVDVTIEWIMKGSFYVLDFTVGEEIPDANYSVPIPGPRGGTLLSRYYGKLEGVSPETKELMQKAHKNSKKSLHEWVDEAIKVAAMNELSHVNKL